MDCMKTFVPYVKNEYYIYVEQVWYNKDIIFENNKKTKNKIPDIQEDKSIYFKKISMLYFKISKA